MNIEKEQALKPSRDQIIYANILIIGVWSGIAIMITTYLIYVSGLMAPYIDISMIPKLWGKGVSEYLEITHSPHGWGWVSLLGRGDFLNYIGFVLLALMTILCYLVLLRGYVRQKNWIFACIALLEIIVLSVAASGILGSGGH
ncbi:MAG: DUF1634 domain-containing protein [Deltaproteobacteria bacterium]|jgi:hypothetical protein